MRAIRIAAGCLIFLAGPVILRAELDGAPAGHAFAPFEGSCSRSGCHNAYPVNSGAGSIAITVPSGAADGDTLTLTVQVSHPGAVRWGLEVGVCNKEGAPVGELLISDPVRTRLVTNIGGRSYITHTRQGTDSGLVDASSVYAFRWASPQAADRPDYFWIAAVASNGDGLPYGDWVYVDSARWPVSINCPITRTGDVNVNGSITSADIISIIGYIFKGGASPQPVPAAADVNCTGTVTSADIIYLVNFVFKGAQEPCDVCLECSVNGWSWSCP